MGATNSFIGADFILGQANLVNPDYVIERWHTVLVAWLISFLAAFINLFGSKLLDRISKGALAINVVSFVVTVVVILATNTNKGLFDFSTFAALMSQRSLHCFLSKHYINVGNIDLYQRWKTNGPLTF